ncbi:MAG: SMP-30/gluconolactonase/LRE family protein [Chelatococcus sp.]|uniref:SMP-30/gluconolactonase/LRE family protein n=1 Tax=Chelatococcus sp. TaxID=1953771 RepID=UPI0025BF4E32|nr:SMP-30/gluconolactonase/LRE family protein [Chelatococcus sp.]MBX3540889.1 SMP-30/gluconolactonase/LRE family protein [Chelatococcus sp.]
MPRSHHVIAEGLRFPEGPVACGDGSLLVVEIASGALTRVGPDGVVRRLATIAGGPNGLAVGPDGAYYVCNNGGFLWHEDNGVLRPTGTPPDYVGGRIERIDPVNFSVRALYTECNGHRLEGPNDLVFDREGGFYFTDYGKVRHRWRSHGGVYYALPDGSAIIEIAYPMLSPNGIGLSPDGGTLYVAETETGRLWAFDIIGPGQVRKAGFPSPHGGRLLCGLPDFQKFDSLAIEQAGNICVATLFAGVISVISPLGQLIRQVNVPDLFVTNICFGGSDRRTAYLTLSSTGRIMSMEWPEAGLPLAYDC